ncbi:MAG: leucyl/phenylalanyl-tRNA--protein transferase [Gammaproteobacteria bacterium]|nr:leucyl/phenylalanyl-tRNA--protein transferase [Gammaproteobacteria bacterium]
MKNAKRQRLLHQHEEYFARMKHEISTCDAIAFRLDAPVTPELYLAALSHGFFPWNDESEPRTWWSPDPRAVLFLDEFHISRSLAKFMRNHEFTITYDEDFSGTVTGCADRDSTWLDAELIRALKRLHQLGVAHSVEAWYDDRLVGGVYGLSLNGMFIGDSMFFRKTNASKVVLVHLVKHLRECGYLAMDCQILNSHTQAFGARDISRDDFYKLAKQLRRRHDQEGKGAWLER